MVKLPANYSDYQPRNVTLCNHDQASSLASGIPNNTRHRKAGRPLPLATIQFCLFINRLHKLHRCFASLTAATTIIHLPLKGMKYCIWLHIVNFSNYFGLIYFTFNPLHILMHYFAAPGCLKRPFRDSYIHHGNSLTFIFVCYRLIIG